MAIDRVTIIVITNRFFPGAKLIDDDRDCDRAIATTINDTCPRMYVSNTVVCVPV